MGETAICKMENKEFKKLDQIYQFTPINFFSEQIIPQNFLNYYKKYLTEVHYNNTKSSSKDSEKPG